MILAYFLECGQFGRKVHPDILSFKLVLNSCSSEWHFYKILYFDSFCWSAIWRAPHQVLHGHSQLHPRKPEHHLRLPPPRCLPHLPWPGHRWPTVAGHGLWNHHLVHLVLVYWPGVYESDISLKSFNHGLKVGSAFCMQFLGQLVETLRFWSRHY